jgi:hypothetical protein
VTRHRRAPGRPGPLRAPRSQRARRGTRVPAALGSADNLLTGALSGGRAADPATARAFGFRTWLGAAVLLLAAAGAGPVAADDEARNVSHVRSGTYGRCYAKSVPEEPWGQRGVTRLYRVERDADELIATFPWFSQELRLQCNLSGPGGPGASLVRFGPWARGRAARAEDLALAFYFGGAPLARYSTLDLAGRPDNVWASVSHYRVIAEIIGYRPLGPDAPGTYAFDLETVDGRRLSFDPATGMPLGGAE